MTIILATTFNYNCTTIALAIHEVEADDVLHPERVADAGASGLVTSAVTRAIVLANPRVQAQDFDW